MRALLTVTHHEGIGESYVLECEHGATNGEAVGASLESRDRLVASLMARHGQPYGCSCAAETDLLDAYPSVEAAVEQITSGASRGLTTLDNDEAAELVETIEGLRCPDCSVAILVLPLHLPLVVVPLHDVRCPQARWDEAGGEGGESGDASGADDAGAGTAEG